MLPFLKPGSQSLWPVSQLSSTVSGLGGGSSLPAWAQGMNRAWDFRTATYYNGAAAPTDTHAQSIQVERGAGTYSTVTANGLCISDLGLQTVPTRTNLFASPAAPATQDVTVANATQYTVSITGTGSITLSGAGSGTVTAGSPVTFTSATTTLTCTVTGSPSTCNVTTGSFAVPPVLSATVAGNQQYLDFAGGVLNSGFSLIMQVDYRTAQLGTTPRTFLAYSSAAGNEQNMVRLNYTGAVMSLSINETNISQAAVTIPGGALTGIQNVAISAGPNYANGRFVGQVASSGADTTVTFPSTMDRISLMGRGFDVATNGYGFTRKMAIKYGAQDDTTFAAAFAQAQLLSAT